MGEVTPNPAASTRVLTLPNILSFARLLSVPVFVWLFLNDRENAGWVLYAVGAWSDFFDGWIARKTNSVSELGKLLDPFADRVLIVALAIMLVARDILPWPLAVAIIGRDVLLLAAAAVLEKRKVPRIAVNFVGKTATAALLAGLTLLAYSETTFPWARYGDDVGLGFTILGAVLYWVAAGMYARVALARPRPPATGEVP